MKKIIDELDLGDEVAEMIPLGQRKSISFLLGAGFSAPKGYPIGNKVNESLLNFSDQPINFSPAGRLAVDETGKKPNFHAMGGYMSDYERQYDFCNKLIQYYNGKHGGFDYEQFYDFIKSEAIFDIEYEKLATDYLTQYLDYRGLINGIPNIYNQMVSYLLKDGEGKKWYDDIPAHWGAYEGYTGILKYLEELSRDYVINVHTLNHDLFFESLNRTGFINGKISDGFDEYGSEYYGVLKEGEAHYNCRLERYTGYYNTSIRLYKLHGSLDYVLYYRSKGATLLPDKYVKIRQNMSVSDLRRGLRSKKKYEDFPFTYHADFLTGTTSKILRYKEPFLYKKIFKKFKKNLEKSEMLIIIGYGAKDEEINRILSEHFDYRNKKVFIIDKYAGDAVQELGRLLNAKVLSVEIEDVHKDLFR